MPGDSIVPSKGWAVQRITCDSGDFGAGQQRWRLLMVGWKTEGAEWTIVSTLDTEEWVSLHPPGRLSEHVVDTGSEIADGWQQSLVPFFGLGQGKDLLPDAECAYRPIAMPSGEYGEPLRIGKVLLKGFQKGVEGVVGNNTASRSMIYCTGGVGEAAGSKALVSSKGRRHAG